MLFHCYSYTLTYTAIDHQAISHEVPTQQSARKPSRSSHITVCAKPKPYSFHSHDTTLNFWLTIKEGYLKNVHYLIWVKRRYFGAHCMHSNLEFGKGYHGKMKTFSTKTIISCQETVDNCVRFLLGTGRLTIARYKLKHGL